MIAIDIDGVICDSEPWLVIEIENAIGRSLRYASPRTFRFDAYISDSELVEHIDNALVKHKDVILPHDRVRTHMALNYIEYREGYVHFVTARSNGKVREATIFWLNKYFGNLDYVLHSLGDNGNKKMWMFENDADALVEDRFYTANSVGSPYTATYLVNREWNRGRIASHYVKRVIDLHSAVEHYYNNQ